jgi:hypothetical protein
MKTDIPNNSYIWSGLLYTNARIFIIKAREIIRKSLIKSTPLPDYLLMFYGQFLQAGFTMVAL